MSDKVQMPFGQSKSVTPDAGFDPKLKEAIAEITAVLKKHDIAGYVSLASKTHGEFRTVFPTWSPVFFDGNNLRFRAKAKDYPTKEAHHTALNMGAWLVKNMKDMSANCFSMFDKIDKMIGERVEITHKPMHGLKVTRDQ